MKHFFATTALITSVSCSTAYHERSLGWCSPPSKFVRELEELTRVEIQVPVEQHVDAAKKHLGYRPFVPIDANLYFEMAGHIPQNSTRRFYYLARAGVMVPEGLYRRSLSDFVRAASFSAYASDPPGSVQIVSLITSEHPQRPRSYPVLLAAPDAIRDVSAVCLGGR